MSNEALLLLREAVLLRNAPPLLLNAAILLLRGHVLLRRGEPLFKRGRLLSLREEGLSLRGKQAAFRAPLPFLRKSPVGWDELANPNMNRFTLLGFVPHPNLPNWRGRFMQLDRTKITLKKQDKQDDSYMDASPQERIAFVWELTAEVWSIRNAEDVEQRLQRNVTKLVRQ